MGLRGLDGPATSTECTDDLGAHPRPPHRGRRTDTAAGHPDSAAVPRREPDGARRRRGSEPGDCRDARAYPTPAGATPTAAPVVPPAVPRRITRRIPRAMSNPNPEQIVVAGALISGSLLLVAQ